MNILNFINNPLFINGIEINKDLQSFLNKNKNAIRDDSFLNNNKQKLYMLGDGIEIFYFLNKLEYIFLYVKEKYMLDDVKKILNNGYKCIVYDDQTNLYYKKFEFVFDENNRLIKVAYRVK